jgi:outer membrane protein OmpA-like peptidoglycan-associated protein
MRRVYAPSSLFCIAAAVLFLILPVRAGAQPAEWVEQPFFVKLMGQYYFHPASPAFAAPYFLKAYPGFRAALGYEWRNFDFSLESGLSCFVGADPYRIYVENLTMTPLLFKLGYTFFLPKGFGLQPEAGFGAVFYTTIHDSIIHPLPRNMQKSFTANMMAAARLNLVWTIPKAPLLRLHIGGGVDMIPETDWLISIPVIEAGITFKPRLPRRVPPPRGLPAPETPQPPETAEPRPVVIPPESSEPLDEGDAEILTDLREAVKDDEDITVEAVLKGIMMTVWNIYYVPDSDRFLPSEYSRLDMIAHALRLVPSNRSFLVEGHVADVPTPVDNMDLSYRRAQRIVDALVQRGIGRDRFVFRAWGGTKPLGDNATEEGRRLNRRVEITIGKKGEIE